MARPNKHAKGKKVVSIRLNIREKNAILADFDSIQAFIEESLVNYFMAEPSYKNRTQGQHIFREREDD